MANVIKKILHFWGTLPLIAVKYIKWRCFVQRFLIKGENCIRRPWIKQHPRLLARFLTQSAIISTCLTAPLLANLVGTSTSTSKKAVTRHFVTNISVWKVGWRTTVCTKCADVSEVLTWQCYTSIILHVKSGIYFKQRLVNSWVCNRWLSSKMWRRLKIDLRSIPI